MPWVEPSLTPLLHMGIADPENLLKCASKNFVLELQLIPERGEAAALQLRCKDIEVLLLKFAQVEVRCNSWQQQGLCMLLQLGLQLPCLFQVALHAHMAVSYGWLACLFSKAYTFQTTDCMCKSVQETCTREYGE